LVPFDALPIVTAGLVPKVRDTERFGFATKGLPSSAPIPDVLLEVQTFARARERAKHLDSSGARQVNGFGGPRCLDYRIDPLLRRRFSSYKRVGGAFDDLGLRNYHTRANGGPRVTRGFAERRGHSARPAHPAGGGARRRKSGGRGGLAGT